MGVLCNPAQRKRLWDRTARGVERSCFEKVGLAFVSGTSGTENIRGTYLLLMAVGFPLSVADVPYLLEDGSLGGESITTGGTGGIPNN